MKTVSVLTKRNIKLFFKDKGMFFTALITPGILLVLYATFLSNVYRDSFLAGIPEQIVVDPALIDALVCGQLISSLMAVSAVTVAFCANFLMVQDKSNGTIQDLRISPVKSWKISVSYYGATLLSSLLICLIATGLCFAYVGTAGWYLSAADTVCFVLDVVLLVLFGTALSSVINFFLSTQGQISAVGTIVSAGYGFICGAYMPISSFGEGLQKAVSFLPGTYGTSLMRSHALGGVLAEMGRQGLPDQVVDSIESLLDCNVYFFGEPVSEPMMYLILAGSGMLLLGIYILLNAMKKK